MSGVKIYQTPRLFFIFLFFFLLPLQSQTAFPAENHFDSTVLIYHRFGEDELPTTNVSVEQFREQMAFLDANNYRVISLAELVSVLKSNGIVPSKSVVITIDDGYRSAYLNAWPILKSHGYPFTVFINSMHINSGFSNYMSWKEVREMFEYGVDIQDHSYAHHKLVDRPAGMGEGEYKDWIRDDLSKNIEAISQKLGTRPRFLAIPYGEYNLEVIATARQLGYEAVLTQDPGSVSEATDPYLIPREAILGVEWSTLPHFKEVIARVDLPISDLVPAFGDVVKAPPYYGARVVDIGRYDANSFGLYVSEVGWLETNLEGDKVIAPAGIELTRKLNRVMIKAREKESGRTAVRSWLLVRNDQ